MTEKLAQSFNNVAVLYDQYRTGYQHDVIQDIIELSSLPSDALICEIGSGSGLATISFAEKVKNITCIEPGESLIALAKQNLINYPQINFQNSRFEDAVIVNNSYDLVYAAQSFHWIDAATRYQKVAKILKPGGAFAAFWKRVLPASTPLQKEIQRVCLDLIPDYEVETLEVYENDVTSLLIEITSSNRFERCQLRRYPSRIGATPGREYIGELKTWSRLSVLPLPIQDEFCTRIESAINSFGGSVPNDWDETVLIFGKKVK